MIVPAFCCSRRFSHSALTLLAATWATASGVTWRPAPAQAETGYDAWLRYAPFEDSSLRDEYSSLPAAVLAPGNSIVHTSARDELLRGVRGMLGRTLRVEQRRPDEPFILLATLDEARSLLPPDAEYPALGDEGYWLKSFQTDSGSCLLIGGPSPRGVLYGVFAFLRKMSLGEPISELDERSEPFAPVRILNHWDNLDGTIERGYAGRSIFWENGHVQKDLRRVGDYARLMASIGVSPARTTFGEYFLISSKYS